LHGTLKNKKSQKLEEGVPRAPDWRSRLKLIESASPIAFAKLALLIEHAECQLVRLQSL
jgi:hypothetical protein